MFEAMFNVDNYIEKLRPHAVDAANGISAYAERIIGRLDDIAESVRQDETLYQRYVIRGKVGSGENFVKIEVPSRSPNGEDWQIESFTMSSGSGTSTPILWEGEYQFSPVSIPNPAMQAPLFAGTAVPANSALTFGPNGARVPAGTFITLQYGSDGAYRLQLRAERRKPLSRSKGLGSGQLTRKPDAPNDNRDDTQRHLGPGRDMFGVNVIGERHG